MVKRPVLLLVLADGRGRKGWPRHSLQQQQQTKGYFPESLCTQNRQDAGQSPDWSSPAGGCFPIHRNSFIVLGEGVHAGTGPTLLTRIVLKTENLCNWCHQVARKAIVGVCTTSTSFFSPLPFLSSPPLHLLVSFLEIAPTSIA